MRHSKKINHLGRTSAHRKALLANMANSLIFHKRISTTTAKAKALRGYVEPLITKAKDDTTHSRRIVFSYLKSKTAVSELFRDVAEKIGDRPGGYTRILKTGNRLGDSAEMCIIELVDFNENMLAAKEVKTKSRRSRRGSSKKAEAPAVKADGTKAEAAKAEDVEVTEAVVTDQAVPDDAVADEPQAGSGEPKAE
jgi:large subunit ribosomal protein L17